MLEQGIRTNLAKLTMARNIAAIVLAMWKGGTVRPRKTQQLAIG